MNNKKSNGDNINKKNANHSRRKHKKTSKKSKKSDTKEAKAEKPLTFSKLKLILEMPTYKSNEHIMRYTNFVNQVQGLLNSLNASDRYLFCNNHISKEGIEKWNDRKKKFIKLKYDIPNLPNGQMTGDLLHTPLTMAFHNFVYAHTSMEQSQVWFALINLLLSIHNGSCVDCTFCNLDDCTKHTSIIEQLYQFVNISDESLYGISTNEFSVRGGFKLLIKAFNESKNIIPPMIVTENELKRNDYNLKLGYLCDYPLLLKNIYCLSANALNIRNMKYLLKNGHPIMGNKNSMNELMQEFYIPITDETQNDEAKTADKIDVMYPLSSVIMKFRQGAKGKSGRIGVLSWLTVLLPMLIQVRNEQRKVLKKCIAQNANNNNNNNNMVGCEVMIEIVLDMLYWNEKYIRSEMKVVNSIIAFEKNELVLFNYMINEYAGQLSLKIFIERFIDNHMKYNRNCLKILFKDNINDNNLFYLKLIEMILKYFLIEIDEYFPFIISKIIEWDKLDLKLFKEQLMSAIICYFERFTGNILKMKCKHLKFMNSNWYKKKSLESHEMAIKWIIHILKLMDNNDYTHEMVYRLCSLHFKHKSDAVEELTLRLIKEILNCETMNIDIVNWNNNDTNNKECILFLLCRNGFDSAFDLFLQKYGSNKEYDLLITKQTGDGYNDQTNYNNAFLCLAVMAGKGHSKRHQLPVKRCKIFKSLCGYAKENEIDVSAMILCDNGSGKNALQIANETCIELFEEMKKVLELN